jgi:hypothetical protein
MRKMGGVGFMQVVEEAITDALGPLKRMLVERVEGPISGTRDTHVRARISGSAIEVYLTPDTVSVRHGKKSYLIERGYGESDDAVIESAIETVLREIRVEEHRRQGKSP